MPENLIKTNSNKTSDNPTIIPPMYHDMMSKPFIVTVAILIMSFIWSYWSVIANLLYILTESDEYSSGLLVPFMVAYIIWSRRQSLLKTKIKPSILGLIGFLIVAQGARLFGIYYMFGSIERYSIILSIGTLIVFLLGWKMVWKLTPILIFLVLMIPLPKSVEMKISLPLQEWATTSAVFCLETIGYNLTREGHIIHIGNTTVAVAEACNGLRMISAFFVIIGLVTLIANRTWWEKLILILSAIPISLLCNTIRLTITSIAFTMINGEQWQTVFHDWGGYAMMPLALGLVIAELWFLSKIFIDPDITPDQDKTDQVLIINPKSK